MHYLQIQQSKWLFEDVYRYFEQYFALKHKHIHRHIHIWKYEYRNVSSCANNKYFSITGTPNISANSIYDDNNNNHYKNSWKVQNWLQYFEISL